jgi:glycosyltransferase involved in cell wall biosynthesis
MNVNVSVIIPTLNEAKNIEVALKCLVDNQIPLKEMEVLIIDSSSKDNTVEKAITFSDRLNLKVIDAPGASVYKALNIGLKEAKGKYFVRVDARSEIPNNYIKTCIKHLETPKIGCVGGIQLQYGTSTVSHSIARVTSSFIGTGGAKFRTAKKSGFVDSVYLGVYKTQLLKNLGGYEDRSDYVSEDSFINRRIRELGEKVYLDSSLTVRYPAKSTYQALIKQYVIYGAAKAFLVRQHGKLTSPRQLAPLAFLFFGISSLIGTIAGLIPSLFLVSMFIAYFLVVILANIELIKHDSQNPGSLLSRSLASVCIHFAWPIGFFLFLLNPAMHKRLVMWL